MFCDPHEPMVGAFFFPFDVIVSRRDLRDTVCRSRVYTDVRARLFYYDVAIYFIKLSFDAVNSCNGTLSTTPKVAGALHQSEG